MRAQSIPPPAPTLYDASSAVRTLLREHLRHCYANHAWALGFRPFEFFDLTPICSRSGSAAARAGTRVRRLATSGDRPAPATPWSAPSLRASRGRNFLQRLNPHRLRGEGVVAVRYCVARGLTCSEPTHGRSGRNRAARSLITEHRQPWSSLEYRFHGRTGF